MCWRTQQQKSKSFWLINFHVNPGSKDVPELDIPIMPWPIESRQYKKWTRTKFPDTLPPMIHENLPRAIENLYSRIIAIRDSL